MKFNYLKFYDRINSFPASKRYWILAYVMGDLGFSILEDDTKIGRKMFQKYIPVHFSESERCRIIMQLDLIGISVYELVLAEYLHNYICYVKSGMHPTAPFHIQMKKEIKNLIDKVESGII